MTSKSKKPSAPVTPSAPAMKVTKGNIAFDKDGNRRIAGERIALTAEQAKVLNSAGIIE